MLLPTRYKYSSVTEAMKEFKYKAQVSVIANIIKILLAYVLCKFIGVSGAWITFLVSSIIIIIALKMKVKNSSGFF